MKPMNEHERKATISKLETLSAITFEALGKINQAMERPDANMTYLTPVAEQLRKTLRNCGEALERLVAAAPPEPRSDIITEEEIRSIDFDKLGGQI